MSKSRLTANEYARRYRAKKRAKGLCYWGGCNRKALGKSLCKVHRQRELKRITLYTHGHDAVEHYDLQIRKQKNLCAICECRLTRPQRDHNHATNQKRGVLCTQCNCSLERLESKPAWVESALTYLSKWGKLCIAQNS